MPESDAELVRRARAGDRSAFESLIRRHFRLAFAVALARTGCRAEAEDVCQDALFQAYRRLGECREPDRFGRWLVRIVRNHALNAVEKRRVRRWWPLSSADHRAASDATERRAELSELAAALSDALAALPVLQREVVLLHDLEGMTHAAIASALSISEFMSRRHLSDARRRLRHLLRDVAPPRANHA